MLLSGVVGCCSISCSLLFAVDAVVCCVLIVGAVCWCVMLVVAVADAIVCCLLVSYDI